ncbi:pitrilysin family protein [Aquincola sp. MAHUQ-54]|uniref:Pitrilysin family protein n=1 Tax=Aquincola agrisoli TaxID=3119538 RepID=A0AAW9QLR0_9BURK
MIRRRELLAGLPAAALLGARPAQAADPALDAPPPPGPPRPVSIPPLHEERLPNGMTVVVAPRRGLPLVSATLLVRVGAESDPPDGAGLAELVAGLLTKGAERGGRPVGAPEIARQAEALGGSLDAGSGWRSSSVGMTVTPPRLDAALALMSDALRSPLLQPQELERLRVQAVDNLRVAESDPGSIADRVARRLYWGGGAYGAVTSAASLQRLTRDEVVGFHRQGYRPGQSLLVLAGDITPEQGQALAERHFGGWRPNRMNPLPRRDGVGAPLSPRSVLVDLPGAGQSAVIVLAPFTSLSSDDRPELRAAQVANAVLGGGYSARLNQEVRIRRGLSYGAGTSVEMHPEGGAWQASAQTDHRNAAQVAGLLRDEVLRLGQAPPSAEELAARQATLVGSFSRRLETNGGVASLVAGQWAQGRPLADLANYVPEILAVTPAQVRDFAVRRWKAQDLRTVVVGDVRAAPEAFAALADADATALRLRADALVFDGPGLQAPPR